MIQIEIDETPIIVGATNESKTRIEQTVNKTVLVRDTFLFILLPFYFGCC